MHHAISASLSALKVINEVMKLLNHRYIYSIWLNDIEVHAINITSLLYDDYAGILVYSRP